MKFLEDAKKVRFDPEKHIYTLDGKELLSITKFIEEFSHPFDPDGSILKRCAARDGVSPDQLKKKWQDKGTKAADSGTLWHKSIEHYLNTGEILTNDYTDIVEYFKERYRPHGKVLSECRIFSEELGLCGTADLIEVDNKIIYIKDFKTNEKRVTDYSYGRKMKPPLEHLNDSKLQKYELQISLYLFILASEYNYEVGNDNCIYWVDRKKRKIEKIPVKYRAHEVVEMISHWTYMKSLTPEQQNKVDNKKEEWEDLI